MPDQLEPIGPKIIKRLERALVVLEDLSSNTDLGRVPRFRYALAELQAVRAEAQLLLPGFQAAAGRRRHRAAMAEIIEFSKACGLPASDGEWLWNHFQGNGWRNNGKPVFDWRATVRSWKLAGIFPSQRASPNKNGNGSLGPSGADKIISQKEYERVLERLQTIRSRYSGMETWTVDDRGEYANLKRRRDELKERLGIII